MLTDGRTDGRRMKSDHYTHPELSSGELKILSNHWTEEAKVTDDRLCSSVATLAYTYNDKSIQTIDCADIDWPIIINWPGKEA